MKRLHEENDQSFGLYPGTYQDLPSQRTEEHHDANVQRLSILPDKSRVFEPLNLLVLAIFDRLLTYNHNTKQHISDIL